MQGMLGKLAGIDVILNHNHPRHPTRTVPETVRYDCHPHIRKLLIWLGIAPYIEAVYHHPDEGDPFLIPDYFGNTKIVCGIKAYNELQKLPQTGF